MTPAVLAASGATTQDLDVLIVALAADEERLALVASRSAVAAAASAAWADAQEWLWRCSGDEDAAAEAANLRAQAIMTAQALEAVETQLRSDALAVLGARPAIGASGAAAIQQWDVNRWRAVPLAWHCLELSDPQWTLLERAWTKSSRGLDLTSAEASALTGAQAHPDVLQAEARIEANAAAIDAAFRTYLASATPPSEP